MPEYKDCFNKNHDEAVKLLKELLIFDDNEIVHLPTDTLLLPSCKSILLPVINNEPVNV